jgi:putative phosphoribosyl transferase
MHKSDEIDIKVGQETIKGFLTIPQDAAGLVLFAHGSGSGRQSPRNQFVAKVLNENHFATLLMDLLTPREETIDLETHQLRFDITLLAERLSGTVEMLKNDTRTDKLNIGYFGASTGAAAALVSAAENGEAIRAIVSRGGRPDLAGLALERVVSPTLLIVGGDDSVVIELNQKAYGLLNVEKKLEIIPGATHLFEEPGTLEQVATLATKWFTRFL